MKTNKKLYLGAKLNPKTIVGERNGKKITLEELLKTGKVAFLKDMEEDDQEID